jgi:hypothetical protein
MPIRAAHVESAAGATNQGSRGDGTRHQTRIASRAAMPSHPRTSTLLSETRFMRIAALVLSTLAVAVSCNVARAQASEPARAGAGRLLQRVLEELDARFSERWFRDSAVEEAIERGRRLAPRAPSLDDERALAQGILETIPVSHLGLLSSHASARLHDELAGRAHPTLGFQLIEVGGEHFACDLLCEGAGALAGVLAGDRVLEIDGVDTAASPRLDWRSDDAALDDPPRHLIRIADSTVVRFLLERRPGVRLALDVEPTLDCAAAADRRAARIFELEGKTLGYVPLRFVYNQHAVELVREALDGPLDGCDGLILDLRGRGGSAQAAHRIARLLRAWRGPIVCLVDSLTRSAKEVLAHDLRRGLRATLVGERTAGAVRPCGFIDVGDDTVLMTPVAGGIDPEYTDALELRGCAPDVAVATARRFSAGADPILDRGIDVLARAIDAARIKPLERRRL